MTKFEGSDLKKLFKPNNESSKSDNGQLTIIAGSRLFHGPPLVTLKVASRIVDMVFLSSPEPSIGKVAENLKSELSSFIWVPWEETEDYIKKTDVVLIGPGFMRFGHEKDGHLQTAEYCDETCRESREITRDLLMKFPEKKWVIDGGSLQVMDKEWIPKGAILTPNKKEYKLLINDNDPQEIAKKYKCTIVLKGVVTYVYSPSGVTEISGGNAGLTKGATGDVQAGLTAALYCKNDVELAASSAAYVVKLAADKLFEKVGFNYNADDLTDEIPHVMR